MLSIKPNLIVVLLSITTLISCGKNVDVPISEQVLRPVKTMVLASVDRTLIHEFTAVVDAVRKADLSFKVSGELAEFYVKQGDHVAKGDVLAKLNDTDILIQVNDAQSQFNKAKSDYDRAKSLIKTDYISKSDFEQLKAKYNSAQAHLDSANNNLRYTELLASFDGIIAKTYTEKYQEISAKSAVVRLHDISQVKLIVNIPESMMFHLQKNGDKSEVYATFNGLPEKQFPLTFSEISTISDEHTKTFEVIFTMDSPQSQTILPGMSAVVSAQISLPDGSEPAFYLPANTVLKDRENNFVYVVTAKAEGQGMIRKKVVVIGDITPLGIEVFSGLKQGDAVITAGMSKVSDGMLVKL